MAFKSNRIVLICKSLSQRSQQLDGLLATNSPIVFVCLSQALKHDVVSKEHSSLQFITVQYSSIYSSSQITTNLHIRPNYELLLTTLWALISFFSHKMQAATQRLRQKIDAVLTPKHTLVWQGTVQPTNMILLRNGCISLILSTVIVQKERKTAERSAVVVQNCLVKNMIEILTFNFHAVC